jgi:hypothetical protein
MEPRFGCDFSDVRIHTDSQAVNSARAVNALAYTVGRDVVFGSGKYAPNTRNGRRLLAHELTHTVQQQPWDSHRFLELDHPRSVAEHEAAHIADRVASEGEFMTPLSAMPPLGAGSTPPLIQRELMAYKTEHTDYLPTIGDSAWVTYEVSAADAARILAALQSLIAAGRVGVRDSGDRMFFFSKGASFVEIASAFGVAGFTKNLEMAAALIDDHQASLYSRERITKMSGLFTMAIGEPRAQVVERQLQRSLTNKERSEASIVFGNSLNLDQITVAEDPILGSLGYARTLPSSVNFPPGSFGEPGFMPWLIHELTHSWQYQHGISIFTTIFHALRANYDYGYEGGLKAAQAAGKGFTSFNTEQQGDILKDYYARLKHGWDVTTWLPFVHQVQRMR